MNVLKNTKKKKNRRIYEYALSKSLQLIFNIKDDNKIKNKSRIR